MVICTYATLIDTVHHFRIIRHTSYYTTRTAVPCIRLNFTRIFATQYH